MSQEPRGSCDSRCRCPGPLRHTKPLAWIRREGQTSCLKAILAVEANKLFREEFALGCKNLDPLVSAIGDIHEPIVGNNHVVDG